MGGPEAAAAERLAIRQTRTALSDGDEVSAYEPVGLLPVPVSLLGVLLDVPLGEFLEHVPILRWAMRSACELISLATLRRT